MSADVRQGDSTGVGPCYAKLSDDTPIDLTGAKIWSSVCETRDGDPIFTRKNLAGGGDGTQISDAAVPANGGPFYVYLSSANTSLLTVNKKYYGDVRVLLPDGSVYTVAEYEFRVIDPFTGIPA